MSYHGKDVPATLNDFFTSHGDFESFKNLYDDIQKNFSPDCQD